MLLSLQGAFVAQMLTLNGLNSQHVSPKSKYADRLAMEDSDGDAGAGHYGDYCDQDEAYREESRQALLQKLCNGSFLNSQSQAKYLHTGPSTELTFYDHLAHDIKKSKTKSLAKPSMRKTSTLMKPTASQLAKQNQQRQVYGSRFQKNEGISGNHCGVEGQASKRQKLDGGLLRKIVNMKQPVNLTHKVPKKEAAMPGMNPQNKLRITIPREPDLATAHRAERIRSTNSKEGEHPTIIVRRFKAQPLNRKKESVLPFSKRTTQHVSDLKVSHPKTTGSTNQHSSNAESATACQIDKVKGVSKVHGDKLLETAIKDGKRIDSDVSKGATRQVVHTFKARPLDRKILSSRGDIGVFRNNKREVTVPKEFEFQTAKRTQHNLPIELFSKLSLAGEPQSKNFAQVELPQRTSIPTKGSKENRWEPCQENHINMKYQAKERQSNLCGKERMTLANGEMVEITSHKTLIRPFGGWK